MLVLEVLVGLHRTIQLQPLGISGWGIDLDYCDIEFFALEMNRDHSVVFEIKLPTSIGSRKKGSYGKICTSALLTILKPLTVWITTNWKILEEMEIVNHLTCLLRNMYAGQ